MAHNKPKPARPGYRLVPCNGAAHSNPHIDYCQLCAPRWAQVERLSPESIRAIAAGTKRGGPESARELARIVRDVMDACERDWFNYSALQVGLRAALQGYK